MAELLAEEGHVVTEATSGAEGLARPASGSAVDLVLTDLGMPGITGWEVARAVKATHPSLPAGFITGWGEDPKGTSEERAAIDFVLTKPVTRTALHAQLARVSAARAGSGRPQGGAS